MPVQRAAAQVNVRLAYADPHFRADQVRKYYNHGLEAFTPQEWLDVNRFCAQEFNDTQLFERLKAEKLEKWSKEHPYASKVYLLGKSIHDFSNKNFSYVMGGVVVTTVFFYPYIANAMQSQASV